MSAEVRFAFNWQGTWSAATRYNRDDLVYYDGSVYRAKLASLAQNPSTATTFWEIFVSKGGIYIPNVLLTNVKDYGALGDGATDDTAAIQAAQAACVTSGAVLYFPPGTYMITSPITFNVCMQGSGRSATTIKAKSTFVGARMLDFNAASGTGRFIRDMAWDAGALAGVQIFGSSSAGGAGGNSMGNFVNLWFKNTSVNVYAVGGSSGTTEAGMLTGAVFVNCLWNACPGWLNVGNNQDDVTFIGCRFTGDGTTPTSTYRITTGGKNINFIGSYVNLTNTSQSVSGIKPLIFIGAYEVRFSGCFFEGTTDATHIFFAGSTTSYLIVENCHGIITAASMVALIRSQVNATSGLATHEVRNFLQSGLSVPIWDIFQQNNTTDYITLIVSGCDSWPSVFQWGTSSSGTEHSDGNVRVFGAHLGLEYANAFKRSSGATIGVSKRTPADGRHGLHAYEATASTASAASPAVQAFTLPSSGIWLVTCTAKLNGSKDHMQNRTDVVYFHNATNDTLAADQLGTTKTASGSAFGLSTLALAAPSAAGALSYTSSWTDGLNHTVTWDFRARKLSSFDGPWVL